MLIYCDSVILIYYFEGAPSFKARATTRLTAMWTARDGILTSDLVRLECRMLPIRVGDAVRLADYDQFFSQAGVQRASITSAVFDRATLIRAAHNFKLADSLHLAAAVQAGCDRFLTNDTRLSSFTDVAVEALP
jgi:predicted nucleic acid-binding protein